MKKVTEQQLQSRLKKLCDENFKAKAIMDANNNNFHDVPDFQKQMLLKVMKIDEVTFNYKVK